MLATVLEPESWSWVQSVADRDLKLTNLLLNRDQARAIIKVCDFGYWKVRQVQ